MDESQLMAMLRSVADGSIPPGDAADRLKRLPFEDLGFARVDHHRSLRSLGPEAVLARGKTPEEVAGVVRSLVAEGDAPILVTKASPEQAEAVRKVAPEAVWHRRAGLLVVRSAPKRPDPGLVVVIAAGTSDLPVAEEASATAAAFGHRVDTLVDVGVAGVHRLLAETQRLRAADVVVVVAGMEGALPSLVTGLVAVPVIAVPTSVGYGASFDGLAALLGMLNTCAVGMAVVNIDNGFGAGSMAARILAGRAVAKPAEERTALMPPPPTATSGTAKAAPAEPAPAPASKAPPAPAPAAEAAPAPTAVEGKGKGKEPKKDEATAQAEGDGKSSDAMGDAKGEDKVEDGKGEEGKAEQAEEPAERSAPSRLARLRATQDSAKVGEPRNGDTKDTGVKDSGVKNGDTKDSGTKETGVKDTGVKDTGGPGTESKDRDRDRDRDRERRPSSQFGMPRRLRMAESELGGEEPRPERRLRPAEADERPAAPAANAGRDREQRPPLPPQPDRLGGLARPPRPAGAGPGPGPRMPIRPARPEPTATPDWRPQAVGGWPPGQDPSTPDPGHAVPTSIGDRPPAPDGQERSSRAEPPEPPRPRRTPPSEGRDDRR